MAFWSCWHDTGRSVDSVRTLAPHNRTSSANQLIAKRKVVSTNVTPSAFLFPLSLETLKRQGMFNIPVSSLNAGTPNFACGEHVCQKRKT